MGKHNRGHHNGENGMRANCCCPCSAVSSVFRRIGRCMFVSCYPVIQCFRLDDSRRTHHNHFF